MITPALEKALTKQGTCFKLHHYSLNRKNHEIPEII